MIDKIAELFSIIFPLSQVRIIAKLIKKNGLVGDFGCGEGNTVKIIRKIFKDMDIVAFDIHYPSLEKCRNTKKIVQADLHNIPFKDKAFSTALAIMVVEHVEKGSVFAELERCAKRVIISIPNGFVPHRSEKTEYDYHKCGYSVEEMRNMGYEVYGLNCKAISQRFCPIGRVWRGFRLFFTLLSELLTVYTYRNPESADLLVCVKDTA